MEPELKRYLDAMREDLRTEIAAVGARADTLNAETRSHSENLQRQNRILIEALHLDVRAVAEGVQTVNEKLDHIFSDHERRFRRLEERMP